MNFKLLALICLLQVLAVKGVWKTTKVKVTRKSVVGDYFAFSLSKDDASACTKLAEKACGSYNSVPTSEPCNPLDACCKSCQCKDETPTFLVHENRCVSNNDIKGNSSSECQYYLANKANSSATCTSPTLPTIDTVNPGKIQFAICGPADIITDETSGNILRCEIIPHNSHYLENGEWLGLSTDVRRTVKHGFTLNKLQLQWDTVSPVLHGLVLSMAVKCVRHRLIVQAGLIEMEMKSCFKFKISGTRTWPGPRIQIPDPTTSLSTHSISMTTSVNITQNATSLPPLIPTGREPASTSPEGTEASSMVDVTDNYGPLLIGLAAVLGTLLMLVFVAIIAAIIVFRRKRRKADLSMRRKNRSNPLYERGIDPTLGGKAASLYTNYSGHFYQPLVVNTRPTWPGGKEPIYQTLDSQSRETTNHGNTKNSLPYCDMTEDGYLMPVDDHTYPTPPQSEGNVTDMTDISHPSSSLDSRNYDKPEGIIVANPEQEKVDGETSPEKLPARATSAPVRGQFQRVPTPEGAKTMPVPTTEKEATQAVTGSKTLPDADQLVVALEPEDKHQTGDVNSEKSVIVDTPEEVEPAKDQLAVTSQSDDSDNESCYEDMQELTLPIEEGKPFYFVLHCPAKGTKKSKRRKEAEENGEMNNDEVEKLPDNKTVEKECPPLYHTFEGQTHL
ncbi:predicted protein [Nematostella vectensis]|uniref:Uncharacterized protein n=1 Tax=Nematostella vectensis TaxID=45351 RepID=A7RK59_NEMVE|nr:predicted protein [Nematostella vectensis]|eukprot:XP_001640174.1 predicted protein [Nematostella vectensis]